MFLLAHAIRAGFHHEPSHQHQPCYLHGQSCIRGLRYPLETILEGMAAGMTPEEILADYEDLERDDLLAALSNAAQLARVKHMAPFAA